VSNEQIARLEEVVDSLSAVSAELFEFDPNTVEFFDLCRMGFTRNQALSIIKYRERGKVFEIPEDFASCYAVSESTFNALRPYIRIGEEYALKPFSQSTKPTPSPKTRTAPLAERFEFMPDTASVATFMRLGFSETQAKTIIKYRTSCGGFYSIEQFEKCYVVSSEIAEQLRPYAVYAPKPAEPSDTPTAKEDIFPIELNSADSALLCRVVGIGPKSAAAIIAYRQKLGGFHSAEQLSEVWAVTEQNFERILPQIWVDSCNISKIDINFASAEDLELHPYMTRRAIRKIVEQRELKGGWTTVEEMIDDDIFTKEQAQAIAPYLHFGIIPHDFVIPETTE
jgi:competence ComEA-like helix-hairpin-helix protein